MSSEYQSAITGGLQGASTGAAFGPWGAIIGAGVGIVFGGAAGKRRDNLFAAQQAWSRYGVKLNYSAAMFNIKAQSTIASLNAMAIIKSAELSASAAEKYGQYNAALHYSTQLYNDSLLNQELFREGQAEDLALDQLARVRARERGSIEADQSASGTVMGEGSNADVIVSQMTQEAMDALLIEFNADKRIADIRNKKAQSSWMAELAIDKAIFDGERHAYLARANARIQAVGTLATSVIQTAANTYSADLALQNANIQIDLGQFAFDTQASEDFMAGLFSAGSTAAGVYGSQGNIFSGMFSKPSPGATAGFGGAEPSAFKGIGSGLDYGNRVSGSSLTTRSYGTNNAPGGSLFET